LGKWAALAALPLKGGAYQHRTKDTLCRVLGRVREKYRWQGILSVTAVATVTASDPELGVPGGEGDPGTGVKA
jgi:hypothetical protein